MGETNGNLPILTYEQFRKLYKATRNFQRYTSQDRADIAASHRQGHVQRQAVGEFFYTHDLCPGKAFDTAVWATQEAYKVYLQSVSGRGELLDALKRAERFISNGVEFGYITMPDADTPDPAHETLPLIRAAIAKAQRD